jgi:hypothetical protein
MPAQILTIEERTRFSDVAFVQPSDFTFRDGSAIDPSVILNSPNVSLYCVDNVNRCAIFTQTPDGVDVYAAPFLYQAQYALAQRLIAVPYDTLHAIADDIGFDPSRLILIYSVGRCGSTVVSRALRHAPDVVSLSEPDVYSQLQMLRERDRSNEAEISALLRSCTKIMCAAAASRGGSAWAFKFRSFGIELSDLLQKNFPEAKVVFLYRAGAAWALSVGRAFGFFKPEALPYMPSMQETFARLVPLVADFTERNARTITPAELLASMWTSAMQRALQLQRCGVPMFAARYEEAKAAARTMLDALFAHCGVVAGNEDAIEDVLAEDAQAGTSVSQEKVRIAASESDDVYVAEVCRLIPELDAALDAGTILAGSFAAPGSKPQTLPELQIA